LLGNGFSNIPVVRQWPSKRHMSIATDVHALIEERLKAVFFVRTMPRHYIEDLETVVMKCSP
jgi:hypothetical protein